MATLQTTTAPTVSASNITSPLAYNNGSLALIEYSGVISININSSVDLITNNSGYGRMTGYGYFVGATTAANPYGYFSFGVSRYGVLSTNLISLSSGNYSLSNFQDPNNVDINSLRFTNNYSSGTYSFSLIIQAAMSATSNVLTRIK